MNHNLAKTFLTYYKVLSQNCPGDTEKILEYLKRGFSVSQPRFEPVTSTIQVIRVAV
jgi:hypothetical protein